VNARLGRVPALALINIPPFRELVTSQLLPEGQSLGVRRLAIFFSDLRGSTALYHRLGDTAAY
jgi:class 3 adenylate cyclase